MSKQDDAVNDEEQTTQEEDATSNEADIVDSENDDSSLDKDETTDVVEESSDTTEEVSDEVDESQSQTVPYNKFKKKNDQVKELRNYAENVEPIVELIRSDPELQESIRLKLEKGQQEDKSEASKTSDSSDSSLSERDRLLLEEMRQKQKIEEDSVYETFEEKHDIKDDITRGNIGAELNILRQDSRFAKLSLSQKMEKAYQMHLVKTDGLSDHLKHQAEVDVAIAGQASTPALGSKGTTTKQDTPHSQKQLDIAKELGVTL